MLDHVHVLWTNADDLAPCLEHVVDTEPLYTPAHISADQTLAGNCRRTVSRLDQHYRYQSVFVSSARVPQAFEMIEEEPAPLDGQQPFDVNQIGELLGKLAVLYQSMKQAQPSPEPRNAAPPIVEENGIGLGASMRGGGAAQP